MEDQLGDWAAVEIKVEEDDQTADSSFTRPNRGSTGGRSSSAMEKSAKRKKGWIRTPSALSGSELVRPSLSVGGGLEDEELFPCRPSMNSPGRGNETDEESPEKKRKKSVRLTLSDEEEDDLVEWLQTHPELFDKGNKKYKDTELKSRLWEEKAAQLDVESVESLHVWYKSMRTRFGKLKKLKAWNRNKGFTSRDQWILENFAFMAPHIYACPNRGGGSMLKRNIKSRLRGPQPAPRPALSTDVGNHDQLSNRTTAKRSTPTPSPSTTSSSTAASMNGPKPSRSTTPLDPTNVMVEQLAQLTTQVHHLQASASGLSSYQSGGGMARGYGHFLSTFVQSLHPSLLTQFYQESWGMVMAYHVRSERLKEGEGDGVVESSRPATQLPDFPPQLSTQCDPSTQDQSEFTWTLPNG